MHCLRLPPHFLRNAALQILRLLFTGKPLSLTPKRLPKGRLRTPSPIPFSCTRKRQRRKPRITRTTFSVLCLARLGEEKRRGRDCCLPAPGRFQRRRTLPELCTWPLKLPVPKAAEYTTQTTDYRFLPCLSPSATQTPPCARSQ